MILNTCNTVYLDIKCVSTEVLIDSLNLSRKQSRLTASGLQRSKTVEQCQAMYRSKVLMLTNANNNDISRSSQVKQV